MSDDTPTVRFPESSGASNPGASATTQFQRPPTRPRPQRPSRGPVVLFVILAILVVAAIVVLLVILDGRLSTSGAPVPSTSATVPTPTQSAPAKPSASPTTAPPPAQPAGAFTTLIVPEAQGCGRNGDPPVMVTWATQDAKSVWIADGSSDARNSSGVELPLSGSQQNVPATFTLDCTQRENTFTITLVGDNGVHVSKTWMIRIDGHHY